MSVKRETFSEKTKPARWFSDWKTNNKFFFFFWKRYRKRLKGVNSDCKRTPVCSENIILNYLALHHTIPRQRIRNITSVGRFSTCLRAFASVKCEATQVLSLPFQFDCLVFRRSPTFIKEKKTANERFSTHFRFLLYSLLKPEFIFGNYLKSRGPCEHCTCAILFNILDGYDLTNKGCLNECVLFVTKIDKILDEAGWLWWVLFKKHSIQ